MSIIFSASLISALQAEEAFSNLFIPAFTLANCSGDTIRCANPTKQKTAKPTVKPTTPKADPPKEEPKVEEPPVKEEPKQPVNKVTGGR